MITRRGLLGILTSPLVLVAGVGSYLVVLKVLLATGNPNLFPTLLLIGASTVPLAVLLLVYAIDRRPEGHAGLVAVTAVAGGAIGTTSAGVLEYSALRAMPWSGMLAVAVIEEAVKLIVPGLIFLLARRRTDGLGVVLGVASGMGFAVLETMGYGFTALISSGGNLAAVDQTLQLRALLSPAGHVAWTGLSAAALWRIGAVPRRPRARAGFVATFVGVVILHALWDSATSVPLHTGIAAFSVLLLVAAVLLSRGPDRVTGHSVDRDGLKPAAP